MSSDLANLSLHTPYTASDDVVIGEGTRLSIAHIGSLSLPTATYPLLLKLAIYVPNMSVNLISASTLCATNAMTVLFLDSYF